MSIMSTVVPGSGFDSSQTYISNSSSDSSPSLSRTSPTTSLHQAMVNLNHKISGIPCVAAASRYTAPVHIDVGGSIYTSSLETLTKLVAWYSMLFDLLKLYIPIDTLTVDWLACSTGQSLLSWTVWNSITSLIEMAKCFVIFSTTYELIIWSFPITLMSLICSMKKRSFTIFSLCWGIFWLVVYLIKKYFW